MCKQFCRMVLALAAISSSMSPCSGVDNPLVDYRGFAQQVQEVEAIRAERLVSEEKFIELMADKSIVILDARSEAKFAALHVKGAKNLSFPEFTEETLAKIIPNKETRVLIYCNNNFTNQQEAFPSKSFRAALNVHTFNALYSYGYKNIYELKPLLDFEKTAIKFEGPLAKQPVVQQSRREPTFTNNLGQRAQVRP